MHDMHERPHNAVESSRNSVLWTVEASVSCGAIRAVEQYADMQGPGEEQALGSKAVVKVGLRALPISH